MNNNTTNEDVVHTDSPAYDGANTVLAVLAQPPFRGIADTTSTEGSTRYLLRGRHNGLTEGSSSTSSSNTAHPESFEYFDLPLIDTASLIGEENEGAEEHDAFPSTSHLTDNRMRRRVAIPVEPYHRSAAGKALDADTLRTPLALEKSMHFLVEHYMRAPHTALVFTDPFKVWGYLWDRFRGIRTTWIPQLPPCGSDGVGYVEADTNTTTTTSSPTNTFTSTSNSKGQELRYLSPEVLQREGRHRVRWLEFTVAALAIGAAYLCRTTTGCRRFVIEKKNFLESMSQCFTDLAVMYRQERRLRNAEYVSLLLLLYGLRQESKAEDRALFCVFTSQYINNIATLCPELPAASVNLSQVYKELEKQPAMLATQPVRIALELLHCWATRNWFRFFYLCRTGKLSFVQRAVLFQSFTYARFRAVLDLVLPNRFVYTKLRMRHDIRISELAELLLMDETHCDEFLCAMGLARSIDRTHRLLRLSDAKSEGFITAEEIEAQCADKQKLFFPTAPSFFGFRVWREAFVRFPHTDFFQHGGTNDLLVKEEEEILVGEAAMQDEHDDIAEAMQDEEEGEMRQTSAPHSTQSNNHSINEEDEEGEFHNSNTDFNEERENEDAEEGDAYYDYRDNSLVGTASQPSARAEEDEANDSERPLSQQQDNNDEDNNEDIQPNTIISDVDDDEDRLLRLPGCPINLMEILEPYCPAYQGEVKRLVLCDVAEELFASIPKHRAAMLRVALQRGPHTAKTQSTLIEEQESAEPSASESESRVTASSVFSDHEHHTEAAETTEHVKDEEAHADIDDETQAERDDEEDITSMNETLRAAQALTTALAQDPLYREALQRRQEQLLQPATKAEEEKAEASQEEEGEDKESTVRDASQVTSVEQHVEEEEQQPATTTTTTTGSSMKGVTITAVLSAQSSPALPPTPNNTTQAHSILVTRSPIVESPLSTPQLPTPLLPTKGEGVQKDTAQPASGSNTSSATAAIAAHPWHTIDNKEDNDVEDVEPITTTIASDSKTSGSDDEEEQRPLAWDEAPSPTLPHSFARKAQTAPQVHATEKTQQGTRKDNPVNIDLTESLPTESSLSSSPTTTENKDVEHAEEEEGEAESTRISSLSTESDVETSVQPHSSPERSTSTRSSRGSSSSNSHHRAPLLPTISDKQQQQHEHHNTTHTAVHRVHDPLRSPSPVSSLSAPSVTNGPAAASLVTSQEQQRNATAAARVHERKQEEEEERQVHEERLVKLPTTTSAGRRKSRSAWTVEARRVCFRRLRDEKDTTHKRSRSAFIEEEEICHLPRQRVMQPCVGLFDVAEEHLQAVWRALFTRNSNSTIPTNTSTVKRHALQNALRFALLNAEMSEDDCKAWMSALDEAVHTEREAQQKKKKTISRRNMTSAGQGSMAAELYKRARLAKKLCCGFTVSRVSLAEAIVQRVAEQLRYFSVNNETTANMTQTLQDCLDSMIGTCMNESTMKGDWQSTAVRMGQYIGQRFAQAQLEMMSRNTHTDGEDTNIVSSVRKAHEKKCEQILVEDEQGRLTALLVSRTPRREHYTIQAGSHGVAMVHNKAHNVTDMTWLLKRRILQLHATFVLVSASEQEEDDEEVPKNNISECAARLFELDVIQALAHNTQGIVDTLSSQKLNDEYSSTKEMFLRLAIRHVVHKGITTSLPSPSSRTSGEMFTTCVSLYRCEASALSHLHSSLVQETNRMSFSYDTHSNTIHAESDNISSSNDVNALTAVSFPSITSIACIALDEEAGTLAKSSLTTLRAIVAQCVKAAQERDMNALRITGVLLFMNIYNEEEEKDDDIVIAEQQRFIEQTFWDLWHDSTRSNTIRGDKDGPCSTSSESDEEAAANIRTHTHISSASSSSAGNRLTRGLWRGHRSLHRPEKLKRLEASKTNMQCYTKSTNNDTNHIISTPINKAMDNSYNEYDAPVLVVMPVMKSRVAECVEAGLRALLEAYRTNVETCHE